jgi:hypothetical protein
MRSPQRGGYPIRRTARCMLAYALARTPVVVRPSAILPTCRSVLRSALVVSQWVYAGPLLVREAVAWAAAAATSAAATSATIHSTVACVPHAG